MKTKRAPLNVACWARIPRASVTQIAGLIGSTCSVCFVEHPHAWSVATTGPQRENLSIPIIT
jgi:hypothetical protein